MSKPNLKKTLKTRFVIVTLTMLIAVGNVVKPCICYGQSNKRTSLKKESNRENPRGLYKMTKLIGKKGEIDAPFDQYKYCTDNITLHLQMDANRLLIKNQDFVFNYTGEFPKYENDKSALIFNSNSKHFSLKWWSEYPHHFCFPNGNWCIEHYESGVYSTEAKPYLETLLATGKLNELTPTNFPYGSSIYYDELITLKRIALIIGNSEYQYTRRLNSPVTDATDIGLTLKDLNFDEVRVVRNANAKELKEAIDQFTEDAKEYDVALFYFSGHGIQKDNENYLLPIDFKGEKASELFDCGKPRYVMTDLDEAGCKLKIIILDACRDNPFSMSKGTKVEGLAPMEGSKGSYIVYATAENKTAMDGNPGENSWFTKALLHALYRPGLNLHEVFENVGTEVNKISEGKQLPKINYQPPLGRFIFNNYKQ